MRVDLDALLPQIEGSELHQRFQMIADLETYTLLTPPYAGGAVKELFVRAQAELGMKLSTEYYWFLKCCDGGLLFTNHLFSLLAPDEEDSDLVSMNLFLREEQLIPEGSAAIGETNYGGYIVQCVSGKKLMGIWDPSEEAYIARYEDLYGWLDDMLQEAHYLLAHGGLFEIEDGSDAEDTEREQ